MEFKGLYDIYINGISYSQHIGIQPIESDESKKAREGINKISKIVHNVMRESGISTTGNFRPPFATYEYQNVDIILNIFSDDIIRSFSDHVKDAINQTIGVYENNITNSILNTINPFYWIGKIAKTLAITILDPFGIKIGSRTGDIISLIANLATIIGFILTIFS
ncbi:MAG: hypothetical protein PHR61_01790 [Candidatus Absconditabacteria bacterium]|nr:hypothetical protein [Candidatus Absconditabacteria bacterium]